MATLYEIERSLNEVIENGFYVDEETGECWDSEDLDTLQADYLDKVEACALYAKNLESDARAIREEEKSLADRRRSLEAKAERLRDYITRSMTATGHDKVETPRCRLSFRKTESVYVSEHATIPMEFVKLTETPDKQALKKAIKAGREFDGVWINTSRSLQVK